MKFSQKLIGKVLFNIISIGSLVALSACAEPVTQTPPPVTQSPPVTAPPVADTRTETTADLNLAQLTQAAAKEGQFQTLTRAVEAAGLQNQLATPGPYTVFAPTDAAFDALPTGTLDNLLKPENKDQLTKLIAYHVIPGRFTSNQLTSGEVKTVEGSPVTVDVNDVTQGITVNNGKVTQADIPASNGIVHVIDQVMLPPDFPAT
ncbi:MULTISPECIES: fasciclin domain-containing protein [Cyanophyceae]|uniref:fasciclin domain-containing protein n=1 Tax=Cyanophyceae TaxID=3028117 RepID=UPI00232BDC00|nr:MULTISPECIES: fasciclin domain-containing protein [Cyanophyceae]MDB9318273.1 fasciclin domain-containing protein [Nodularia spumigena CS-590/01A]MDB9325366.1 fasciclin domain-containing protein [Nodularia spumigena CS-590/02]MDB9333651.1 fasciclin domain-containing protein [Nodularia spumigena CS-590/01]MDB9341669.1 fasciclin domain-containing protein [Nodularia spumigena CS-589/07]MDB9402422.1 fasciclin domain-containing protein [Microcystis aeruginosa CS-567/02-A1]